MRRETEAHYVTDRVTVRSADSGIRHMKYAKPVTACGAVERRAPPNTHTGVIDGPQCVSLDLNTAVSYQYCSFSPMSM